MLQSYLEHFDTVEINNSFYRLPTQEAVKNWVKQTPSEFIFAVKASRYITHNRKIEGPKGDPRQIFESRKDFWKEARANPFSVANFAYVRLHGPGKAYQGDYSTLVLRSWARKIESWVNQRHEVFFYFDYDQAGFAAKNAETLQDLVRTQQKSVGKEHKQNLRE